MRTSKVPLIFAILLGSVFISGQVALRAQSGNDASMLDKHFVSEALKGGMAEVQMGQLAAEKGESSDVKKFGRKMVMPSKRHVCYSILLVRSSTRIG